MINMVIAADNNGGIGFKGGLPWPKSENDMFEPYTLGGVYVMGSNTWNYNYKRKLLKDKLYYVISKSHASEFPGCFDSYDYTENTMEQILVSIEFRHPGREVFVIGGKRLFDNCYEYCDRIYLTRVNDIYKADETCNINQITYGFSLQKRINISSTPHAPSMMYEVWEKK